MIELMIVIALLLAILTGIGATLLIGRNASHQTTAIVKLDEDLRTILRRISEELRSASRSGEDTNGNSALDAGEDVNGNGRLEADWSLSADSVTFNRGLPDRTYSLPITFRLNGNVLEYVKQTTAAGATIVTPMARTVTEFTVVENTSMVTITLSLERNSVGESTLTRSQSINVTPRN